MRRGACCSVKTTHLIFSYCDLLRLSVRASLRMIARRRCTSLSGVGVGESESCWVALTCPLCVCSQSGSDFSILCVNRSGNSGGRAEAPNNREIKFKPPGNSEMSHCSTTWPTCYLVLIMLLMSMCTAPVEERTDAAVFAKRHLNMSSASTNERER